ncbi:unnamed protein product [marine sediment metagenome]|uniref:HNH domain-containing protein n=1 Tax=marine sediment metagenome TaxID=412755 RepID=X0XJF3_9ZZZZ
MPYKDEQIRKEYNREYIKQWRKANPEKAKLQYKRDNDKKKKYKREWERNNPEKIKEYHRKRHEKIKRYVDDYKLSKGCSICGYNKCAEALDFHHTGNNKDFAVGEGLSRKSLRLIKVEMAKCAILCRNCHAELHTGQIKLLK